MRAYEETLAWLSALEVSAGWDLKLERMRAAVARRGHPERRFATLHVAGTNGKGSTAAMLEAVLRAAGYRTGLYTSPHLVDFTERIRAGGRTIPAAAVVALVAELRADLEAAGIRLTHFEFATLLAFEWFARVGIEVGVIEVGLGGRLDATNVIEPLATAITSIGHDHQAYLGHDLAAITGEKAGIMKPGVPLVVGRLPAEADEVVTARARALGVTVRRAGVDGCLERGADGLVFRAPPVTWDRLHLALPGTFQQENAAVALTLLSLLHDRLPCAPGAVRGGLARVAWPGRLAAVRDHPLVLLDGAHNPEAAAALARELPTALGGRFVVLVFAVMADKDWRGVLEPILPRVARAVITQVGRRGAEPSRLAEWLADRVPVEVVPEPRTALAKAIGSAAAHEAVLVTGSLFLVGEAYAALGDAARAPLFEAWNGWGGDGTEAAL
jgi:dihydrofolate synthase/folylpolyglutamate synthase